jgi:hypothetical protein
MLKFILEEQSALWAYSAPDRMGGCSYWLLVPGALPFSGFQTPVVALRRLVWPASGKQH